MWVARGDNEWQALDLFVNQALTSNIIKARAVQTRTTNFASWDVVIRSAVVTVINFTPSAVVGYSPKHPHL